MPSGIVVSDLVRSSMRLIGAIATGETPTAEETADGVLCLNDMLENWSTESLSVWSSHNSTFNLIAGQATYTIGPTGNWVTARPVVIDDAYCSVQGVDFPIMLISQAEYNVIPIKTNQQAIVERLLYVNEFPLGLVTVWPTPAIDATVTLSIRLVIPTPVDANTVLGGPPGYVKALRYSLAVEMAPEFGLEASNTVIQVAADSKGDYKRSNIQVQPARYDDALTTPQVALWQRGY